MNSNIYSSVELGWDTAKCQDVTPAQVAAQTVGQIAAQAACQSEAGAAVECEERGVSKSASSRREEG